MTVRMIAVYDLPVDPEAFDAHYRDVHRPLACSLPGLRRYTVSTGGRSLRGEAFHLVAELEWDDLDSLQRAFASEVGRRCAADVGELQRLAETRSMIYLVEEAL